MSKNEIHWAIFSGKTLLPFTIRTTRKQCIFDELFNKGWDELPPWLTCRKVVINAFKKQGGLRND